MSRQARIIYEGAYYHVINRGQAKRKIYLDKADYKTFLNVLRNACEVYGVRIVAYCLMGNHYHILVHTPDANLPDFMRQLNGVYTQIFNQRHKGDGSLFKGRYKANVVQEGAYLLRLIRYIHLNPVKAKIVEKCADYAYSSHDCYVKGVENNWLRYKGLLRSQLKGKGRLLERYEEYMKMEDAELDEYLNVKKRKTIEAIILGDEEFKDQIKEKYLHEKRMYGEIPQAKRIRTEIVVKKIKEEVLKIFGVDEEALYQSVRGRENLARAMAIGLSREIGGMSHKDVGDMFGGISYKSVAKCCERLKVRCDGDKRVRKVFDRLKVICSQVETLNIIVGYDLKKNFE
ncbi:hypothetical protein MNBD_UNCLBAC01-1692 [hydrothermal vent metagenome]|uniref:Transposase IS200-like domain-containing protein n=1 Tax=hydrothermal vent metagenome TaxID=652676 RepID=A0A3B1DGQ9_9ZZZZ